MGKGKITQHHGELNNANIFQNTFESVWFKFKPFSVSNDIKSLQEASKNKRDYSYVQDILFTATSALYI